MRTSLYADDAALLIRPTRQDITNVQTILHVFGTATGLNTNMTKSEIYILQEGEMELLTEKLILRQDREFPKKLSRSATTHRTDTVHP
jgi:hypothetical protein